MADILRGHIPDGREHSTDTATVKTSLHGSSKFDSGYKKSDVLLD